MAVGFWELVLGIVAAGVGYGIVAGLVGAVVYLISVGVMKLSGQREVHTVGGMLWALGAAGFVLLAFIWFSLGGMVWMVGHQQPWRFDANNSDQLTGVFLVVVTAVVIWLGVCSGIAWEEGRASSAGEKHRLPVIAAVVSLIASATVVIADVASPIHGFWRGIAYSGAWALVAFGVLCLAVESYDVNRRKGAEAVAGVAVAIAAGGSIAAYLLL